MLVPLWHRGQMNKAAVSCEKIAATVLERIIADGGVSEAEYAAFSRATDELARTDTPIRGVTIHARRSVRRWSVGDIIFLFICGAVLIYWILVVSGAVYKGKPDLLDRMEGELILRGWQA